MVDRRKSITTKCYGEIIKWDDRKQAKDFFLEAMMNSDDTEHEHYSAVYIQLVNGLSYCTDCEKD
ncbi:MAG: hypothetical protein K2H28_10560 [Ruminococcus sp.]|nr:hypothetical protein [Ruminococcus sp.]